MHICGFIIKTKIVTTSNVFFSGHTGTGRCKKLKFFFNILVYDVNVEL